MERSMVYEMGNSGAPLIGASYKKPLRVEHLFNSNMNRFKPGSE